MLKNVGIILCYQIVIDQNQGIGISNEQRRGGDSDDSIRATLEIK